MEVVVPLVLEGHFRRGPHLLGELTILVAGVQHLIVHGPAVAEAPAVAGASRR